VKTSGGGRVDNEAKLEKMGIPGVTITVDDLLPQRKRVAECNGLPGIRMVTVPAETYFVCECKPEKLMPIAAAAFGDIIETLTSPLTEEEKNPQPFVYNYGPMHFGGSSYDEAYEKFQQYCMENDMGDGLPLTPPTEEAVRQMLAGTTRSPDEVLGLMVPRNGRATIEKVAINGNYCTLVLYPALARQLAAAGYSKQALAQWLCDQHRFPWDDYSDSQQGSILKTAKAGSIPGLSVEDCKPGGTIPNFNPKHLAILVAGAMAGQAMGLYGGAATQPNFDNPGSTEIDYMTQKIHGATLTKAGR
jgi:hypothetical protein